MHILDLLMRVLHVLGATLLVGGLAAMLLAFMPVIARLDEQRRGELFDAFRPRWAMLIGIGTALLLVSGLYNTARIEMTMELPPIYHPLLGVKLILGLIVFALAALVSGRSGLAQKMQTNLHMWLLVTLLLAVATLTVAAWMRSLPHSLKQPEAPPVAVTQAPAPSPVGPAQRLGGGQFPAETPGGTVATYQGVKWLPFPGPAKYA
jgi:putative copper export protein